VFAFPSARVSQFGKGFQQRCLRVFISCQIPRVNAFLSGYKHSPCKPLFFAGLMRLPCNPCVSWHYLGFCFEEYPSVSKFPSHRVAAVTVAGLLALAGCSPINWREVQSNDAALRGDVASPSHRPFPPDQPRRHPGHDDDDGHRNDDVTFAVGSAELPDASRHTRPLNAMKSAMVKNIGGTIKLEKSVAMAQATAAAAQANRDRSDRHAQRSGQPALLSRACRQDSASTRRSCRPRKRCFARGGRDFSELLKLH